MDTARSKLNKLTHEVRKFDFQREVWDEISEKWAGWRKNPSEEVESFSAGKKGRVLDIACGNCRQLIPFSRCERYGIDFSPKMIDNAKKFCKTFQIKADLRVAETSSLPFEDNFFDVVLFLFSLHNLREPERKESLREMKRVMKPGGNGIISVWLKEEKGDREIPWKEGLDKIVYRYYHFFGKEELEKLVSKAGFEIAKSYISGKGQKNIFIEVKKPI